VDDIIGKSLVKKIRFMPELSEHLLFHNEYLGNHYEILLIPREYQYELVEAWNSMGSFGVSSDYEPNRGIKGYADNTHGAFYSGRLAIAEYLYKINRQASVLIVREILPSYDVPMGIWQMRETVRGAFGREPEKFNSLQEALQMISKRLTLGTKWKEKSSMLKNLREQRKITSFVSSSRKTS
jgi:hypothetical protein